MVRKSGNSGKSENVRENLNQVREFISIEQIYAYFLFYITYKLKFIKRIFFLSLNVFPENLKIKWKDDLFNFKIFYFQIKGWIFQF